MTSHSQNLVGASDKLGDRLEPCCTLVDISNTFTDRAMNFLAKYVVLQPALR